ncbi:MAG: hypothetical protein QNK37_17215 [Acidobacteriota bacterium]|nr:hypothetical protein [Acidobacteriota bacterium]
MNPKPIPWHPIVQEIFDDHMELMSGKRILERDREVYTHFQIDYFCRTGRGKLRGKAAQIKGIRPFDHLLEYNVFEYKSINQTLNDKTFREYVARALMFESRHTKRSLRGKLTLNILLTRIPTALLKDPTYGFKPLTPWKFYCNCMGLPVYILIQRKMRGIDGGDPLAFLQVLEGDPTYQKKVWGDLIGQDLTGVEALKDIMMKIGREAYMTIADLIIEEARPKIIDEARPSIVAEAKVKSLTKLLKKSGLWSEFHPALQAAQTLDELEQLENRIYDRISSSAT